MPYHIAGIDVHMFYSFLSIQRNGLPGYWGHGPGANGIYVRRSADGSKT
jgi:hypothetical protein